MEKYGVEESIPPEKLAEVKKENHCPDCDSILEDQQNTGVLICPNCGTKPFEG